MIDIELILILSFLSNIVLNVSSYDLASYSKLYMKGTIYKVESYITCFKHNVCLYEILEIVVVQESAVSFIVNQIQLDSYNSHMKLEQLKI